MEIEFIRKRITELRLAKGVSEVAMSKELGHSNGYITHITAGRENPSVPELLYIIDYLGVSPRTFFTEEENQGRSVLLQKAIDRLERYSEDDLAMILPVLDRIENKAR